MLILTPVYISVQNQFVVPAPLSIFFHPSQLLHKKTLANPAQTVKKAYALFYSKSPARPTAKRTFVQNAL